MKSSTFKACCALAAALAAGSAQAQTPVNKTPVLHLSFDNVSGSTVINGGFGGSAMNGTLNGGASIASGGKFGNCLQVTGVDSWDASCRIANAVVPLNVTAGNAWTVAMWIQSTTAGGAWAYQGNGGWDANNTTFFMAVNNGTSTSQGTTAGGVRWGQGWEVGTATVNDGAWHHIVFTFDGATKVQYVDGVVDALTTDGWVVGTGDSGSGNQFWIGGGGTGQGDGQRCLNGLIDEAYVFNQALSASDVAALYGSNAVPAVPVAVTLNPASGYRGQVVSVTATATPASGTVTNATMDLSAFGLSSAANMVESTANVWTNSFTVPTNAPIGAALVKATMIDTEPLVGSGGATFTVLAKPPTNAIIVTQLTSVSVYQYTEASFHFVATNDAPNEAPFPMAYSWYTNNTLVSSNMGPYFTFLTTPSDSGMQIHVIARVADTNFSSLTVTSATVTLTVNSGSLTYTNGLKCEFFAGATRQGAEIGDTVPGVVRLIAQAGDPGGYGDNHARRYSGYFIPPADDSYVFFVAGDDDTDLFLSTDGAPANKRLIAQETGWSTTLNWHGSTTAPFNSGSIASQKRSDQWTNSVGATPYAAGIPLTGGVKYYIESVIHNGGGGDNWAVTYQTVGELTANPTLPANGSASRMTAASNNIAVVTWPGTTLNWSLQPLPNVTVHEGQNTNFTAIGVSDAEMALYYQWFIVTSGGSFPGIALSGKIVNGQTYTMSLTPASYNNAQVYCVASTEFGGLSITSSVAVVHVLQSVFEPGWVSEKKWMDMFNMTGLEAGTVGDPTFSCVRAGFLAGLDNPGTGGGSGHDSMIQQIGYFVAPSNGNYVFFITSHDGGDLFLSTDNTAMNKRLVAQELGWSGNFAWNSAGGGGTIVSQKRSDTFTNSSGVAPFASGIPLTAGTRYYMEVDHTTSRWGNEQFGVTYRIMSGGGVTAPADGTPPNCYGSVVGMSAIRCSYVAFTRHPTNTTAAPVGYATFSADGVTDSQYPTCSSYGYTIVAPTNALFYQWYKNGAPISGATSKTLNLGPLTGLDDGAQIYCSMRALGYADNNLNPIWTNSQTATLTLSPKGVFEPGYVWVEWWPEIDSRSAIETGSAGLPTYSFTAPTFACPNNGGDVGTYSDRITAILTPDITTNYVFWVNSDDDSDLFLSTNGDRLNNRLVAQEAGWSNPFNWNSAGGGGSAVAQKRSDSWTDPATGAQPYASGIPLSAGQKYWLELVHHNGYWGGHNAMANISELGGAQPANGDDTKLKGSLVGIYAPRIPWVAFLSQPTNVTQISGGNPVTFYAQGTNPPSIVIGTSTNPKLWFGVSTNYACVQYQWYKNGTPIPGATATSYTQPYVLLSDQGAQFVCGLRALGYADDFLNRIYSNSQPAVLTVVTDTVPPTMTYAATFINANQNPAQIIVNVTFSKWMDPASLLNPAHYTIPGVNITNVTIAANHRTVQLLLDAVPTLPLNLTINGIKDLSGNAVVGSLTTAIQPVPLAFNDIGFPGTDPAYPSFIWVEAADGYIVEAQGSDIWNLSDAFDFGWELKTNDFDVVVRGVSNGHTSQYAKMGLMAREELTDYSRHWSIFNTPAASDGIMAPDNSGYGANRIEADMRDMSAGPSAGWGVAGYGPAPAYPNAWLRLKRAGSMLSGSYSTNGLDWVQLAAYDVSTNSIAVTNVLYVGICNTAHNNDVVYPPPTTFKYYNTAEFANYNSSYVPTAPTISIHLSGNNVVISWTPIGGTLLSSPAISGPGVNWQPVGSANPASIPLGAGPVFFRVVTR